MDKVIPVFAINLKSRPERKESVLKEFEQRSEFSMQVVEACRHEVGAFGLWESIKSIIRSQHGNDELLVICEDDHLFTDCYSKDMLFTAIETARENGAEIVVGGASWFEDIVFVSENLVRLKHFTGTQFIVIFSHAFQKILNVNFSIHDIPDKMLCACFDHIYMIYPFISIQKDWGYSDATAKNNVAGKVAELFERSAYAMDTLKRLSDHYKGVCVRDPAAEGFDLTKISIPTYVINLKDRPDRLLHITGQFENRPEFDITIVEAVKHETGAVGLWLSIRKAVEMAVANNDDVIVICEDDHEFTAAYSAGSFFKQVLIAQQLHVEYLSGGCSYFERALPVVPGLYWVALCQATQFIVLYKPVFAKILEEPFDDTVIADLLLSEMVSNKLIFAPGISTQKDFGYSDVTSSHNEQQGVVDAMFRRTKSRLESMDRMTLAHNAFCIKSLDVPGDIVSV